MVSDLCLYNLTVPFYFMTCRVVMLIFWVLVSTDSALLVERIMGMSCAKVQACFQCRYAGFPFAISIPGSLTMQ